MEKESQSLHRVDRMQICYAKAKDYLLQITPNELKSRELQKYFNVEKTFLTKADILHGLLISLQDYQSMPNVIGLLREDRQDMFEQVLYKYAAEEILAHYDSDTLFETFCNNFTVGNKESKNNLWRRFARAVISAAEFINKFKNAEDFDMFVSSFSYNSFSTAALPMVLEKEIYGMGFPLACNFLKDIGYSRYTKPDVHLKEVFYSLGFCDNSDYDTYKAVIEMADVCKDTPFNVDRTFWLICSGNYYLHKINIGRHKKEFIEKMQKCKV